MESSAGRSKLHRRIDITRRQIKVATQNGPKKRELADAIAFTQLRDVAAPAARSMAGTIALGVLFLLRELVMRASVLSATEWLHFLTAALRDSLCGAPHAVQRNVFESSPITQSLGCASTRLRKGVTTAISFVEFHLSNTLSGLQFASAGSSPVREAANNSAYATPSHITIRSMSLLRCVCTLRDGTVDERLIDLSG